MQMGWGNDDGLRAVNCDTNTRRGGEGCCTLRSEWGVWRMSGVATSTRNSETRADTSQQVLHGLMVMWIKKQQKVIIQKE